MSSIDFSTPMRQSRKGILIIFFYNVFKFFKQTFVFIIASIFSLSKSGIYEEVGPFYFMLSLIAIPVVFIVISVLRYYYFKFYLINNEFHLQSGVLNRETVVLSKSKIQNVYIKESFLHRLIGVVSLNIETAGDKASEIEISAIDKSVALLIKEKLFQKNETASVEPEVESKTIFKASLSKLFLEGLTQNHLKSLAIIFGFFAGLYFENRDFIEDYDLQNKALEWLNIDEALMKSIVLVNLFLLLLGLIVSVVFSTVKMVVQNFNLQVIETDKSIEISKGLIQTTTSTLQPNRIQNIEIITNRLKKKLGLHTLRVKQAMATKAQASKLSVVGLGENNLNYLLNNLIPNHNGVDEAEKIHPEKFYKRVLFLRFGILALILNIVIAFNLHWYALLTFLISVVILIFCVNKAFQKTYFYLDDNFLTKGSGLIETKTNILELHKIQTVSIIQNIWHKRRGLASIELYTASQKTILPYLKKIDADELVNYLIYKVESTEKDWM